jgi:RNA polymerase sigma-70 factor (ECF subfamily)
MMGSISLTARTFADLSTGGEVSDDAARRHDTAADRQLAGRILAGDDTAFEDLVGRNYGRVARIAGRFFRQYDVVEEIAQEVFVKAFVSMSTYRAEMPLEHWLSRIAVNACYDQLRRRQRRPETAVSQIVDDPADFYARLGAPPGGAESGYWDREEARLCAEQLLALLSPPERLVLTLLVLEDLSVSEVAALTGWSAANVKIRAFRARGRLRKMLETARKTDRGR